MHYFAPGYEEQQFIDLMFGFIFNIYQISMHYQLGAATAETTNLQFVRNPMPCARQAFQIQN